MTVVAVLAAAAVSWSAVSALTELGPDSAPGVAAWSLATMLMFTATAHFTRMRTDLERMVPPWLPGAPALVILTGVLEIAAAAGLAWQHSRVVAAWGAAALFAMMFPANVHAARAGIPLRGRPPTPLLPRAALQAGFIALCIYIALAS